MSPCSLGKHIIFHGEEVGKRFRERAKPLVEQTREVWQRIQRIEDPVTRTLKELAYMQLFRPMWEEAVNEQFYIDYPHRRPDPEAENRKVQERLANVPPVILQAAYDKVRKEEQGPLVLLEDERGRNGANRQVPEPGDGNAADQTDRSDVVTDNHLQIAKTVDNHKKPVYNNGAITGAYNNSNDPDGIKREAHAERYYASLRNRKKKYVVAAIAKDAGMDYILVSRMYDHLLVNEYHLDEGKKRFDPSYDIAQSLQRLLEGKNIQKHDIILIHHESTEYLLMNRDGMTYDDAHNQANKDYNYAKALAKYIKQKGGK